MRTRSSALLLALMTGTLACSAQQQQTASSSQRPPDGGTRQVLISILIPSLPRAPFTATLQTVSVRQLPNGAEIKMQNRRKIARDAAGRIFQERRMLVPDDGKHESLLTQIEISDPVRHELYICMSAEKVCQLEPFSPPEGPDPAASAPQTSGPGIEPLGKQSIQGINTVGFRQSTTIETGAIGNDRPLTARREFWYSPSLGINLSSTREDPISGFQKFEVTQIVLGDPDSSLFHPPQDAKLIDLRQPNELP